MPTEHIAQDVLLAFVRRTLPRGVRREVIQHLLACESGCRRLLRQVAASPEAADVPEHGLPENLTTPEMLAAERAAAPGLWEGGLAAASLGSRLWLVRDDPRLHTWGLQEFLLDKARLLASEDPQQSLDLCQLALEIVHRLPLDRYRRADVADLRANTLAGIANAKRLLGDLDGAMEAMEQALESLEWGTGDPLDETNVLSIYGSLLTDLGRIDEAMRVLGAGAREARLAGDMPLQAKLILQQASSIGWYDPQRGLALTRRGLALLTPDSDPQLDRVARYQLVILLCELGEIEQARSLYEEWRLSFAAQLHESFWKSRILRLETALARQEGNLAVCEVLLHQLLDHYAERRMHHDLALTTLDLAELFTTLGRFSETQSLLDNILPLLRQWRVGPDVLRAWLMIEEGIKEKTIAALSFKEASRVVRRACYRS